LGKPIHFFALSTPVMLRCVSSLCHTQHVYNVAGSSDGRHLAAVLKDHTIQLWHADSGGAWHAGQVLQGHASVGFRVIWGGIVLEVGESDYVSIAWSPTSNQLASASNDCMVRVWAADDTGYWTAVHEHSHAREATGIAWSPDGKQLASTSEDCTVQLWSIDDAGAWQLNQTLVSPNMLFSLAWSPDGRQLAVDTGRCAGELWRVDDAGQWQQGPTLPEESCATQVTWSPDGNHLISLFQPSRVEQLSIDNSGQWQIRNAVEDPYGDTFDHLRSVRIGGTLHLAVVTFISGVSLLRLDPAGNLHIGPTFVRASLLAHDIECGVNGVAWSPDGRQLAVACTDSTIRIWTVCAYNDRTHHLFSPIFKSWVLALMCMCERDLVSLPLEMWLIVFEQMAALVDKVY
jgi:WD40 repeat protein